MKGTTASWFLLLFATVGLAPLSTSNASAQLAIGHRVDYYVDVGPYENGDQVYRIVDEQVLNLGSVPWMRFHIAWADLGPNDYLIARAGTDEYRIGSGQIEAQGYYSYAFNGDTITLELWAAPGSVGEGFGIDFLYVGLTEMERLFGVCGQDDRVPGGETAAARFAVVVTDTILLCTSYVISTGKNCFLSAGHCCQPVDSLSLWDAVLVDFGTEANKWGSPEEQFKILRPPNPRFEVSVPEAEDWCVFKTKPNEKTGKHADFGREVLPLHDAQGEEPVLCLTGYGVQPDGQPAENPTAKRIGKATSAGPIMAGAIFKHLVDAPRGTSGGPVVLEHDGTTKAIGIQSASSCPTGPHNFAQKTIWPALQTAIAQVCGGGFLASHTADYNGVSPPLSDEGHSTGHGWTDDRRMGPESANSGIGGWPVARTTGFPGSHRLRGPNAGLTLTPMGNVLGVETNGDVCGTIAAQLPAECEQMDPNAAPDGFGVEWYIAVAAGNGLCFNTITFGIGDYDPYACYLAGYGPCSPELSPLEIPSAGWPAPNTGTSVSWAPNCLCGDLVPVYYFGFYVYYGGGPVPLGDFYPGQTAAVVSCDSPPEEDPITDPNGDGLFGIMGCGDDPGLTECKDGAILGVCCVDVDGDGNDETCIPDVSEIECFEILGGSLWFPEADCGPDNNPCPQTAACCVGNVCFQLSEEACQAQGGVWHEGSNCVQGDNTPCPRVPPCEQPTPTRYLSSLSVTLTQSGVELSWSCDPSVFSDFVITRTSSHSPEERTFLVHPDLAHQWQVSWIDGDIQEGRTYTYTLKGTFFNGGSELSDPLSTFVPVGWLKHLLTCSPSVGPAPFQLRYRGTTQREELRLRIFDSSGRELRAFRVPFGGGEVIWDGCDAKGRPVAAGVYHVVAVDSERKSAGTRVVLIR